MWLWYLEVDGGDAQTAWCYYKPTFSSLKKSLLKKRRKMWEAMKGVKERKGGEE
jgi:hypothetical protein